MLYNYYMNYCKKNDKNPYTEVAKRTVPIGFYYVTGFNLPLIMQMMEFVFL